MKCQILFSRKKNKKNILEFYERKKLNSLPLCIDCVSENRHVTAWAILRYWFFLFMT